MAEHTRSYTITLATVKGYSVSWCSNGGVYFGRDLHDSLPDHLQGRHFKCKTIREFEEICKLLES